MIKIVLLTLFSLNAFSQLERPLAEGVCKKDKATVSLALSPEGLRASIKKNGLPKNCTLSLVNSSSLNRRPIEKETFYFVPEACDGRLAVEPGFKKGALTERGFLVVTKMGNLYQGILSIVADEGPFSCELKVRSWKKIEELSRKKRKIN